MAIDKAELEKAILAEAPKQWTRFQTRKLRIEKGKPKWQRELNESIQKAETLRRQYDPELLHIQQNLDRKVMVKTSSCPKCGEPYRGNTMNGKPYCFKCGKRRPDLSLRSESRKLNPGLYPEAQIK